MKKVSPADVILARRWFTHSHTIWGRGWFADDRAEHAEAMFDTLVEDEALTKSFIRAAANAMRRIENGEDGVIERPIEPLADWERELLSDPEPSDAGGAE